MKKRYYHYILFGVLFGVILGLFWSVNVRSYEISDTEDYKAYCEGFDADFSTAHDLAEGEYYSTTYELVGAYNDRGWKIDRAMYRIDLTDYFNFSTNISYLEVAINVDARQTSQAEDTIYVLVNCSEWQGDQTDYNFDNFDFGDFDSLSVSGTGWFTFNFSVSDELQIWLESHTWYFGILNYFDADDTQPSSNGGWIRIADMYINFSADYVSPLEEPVDAGLNDGWNLMSMPVNVTRFDLQFIQGSTIKSFNESVTAGWILPFIYNYTDGAYYWAYDIDAVGGYWLWVYSPTQLYVNWSSVYSGSVNCTIDEEEYLFIAGLSLEFETVIFIIWGLFVSYIFKVKDMFVMFMLFVAIGIMSLFMFNEYSLFEVPVFLQISSIIGAIAFYRAWRSK